jgi:cytidine deaminase
MAETTVVYGFDRDFPPFTFIQDGQAQGFDLDILQAALAAQPVKLTLRPGDWDDIQKALAAGRIQLTSGMARTPEREKTLLFCGPPLSALNVRLFTPTGSPVRSLADLAGQTLATQRGGLYERLAEKAPGVRLALFDSEPEALAALAHGQAQAFLGGDLAAYYTIARKGYPGLGSVGTPLKTTAVYFVAAPGQAELARLVEAGLRRLKGEGSYDKIYRRWFVAELTGSEAQRLVEQAKKASARAYAPYSGLQVGAAVLTRSGRVYTGVNVENALYGLTLTALRVAVVKAVSEGETDLRAAVTVINGQAVAPAADDRQVLHEFNRGVVCLIETEPGRYLTPMVAELLPYGFEIR